MSDTEKWTAVVYDRYDKIATRTFIGDEEAANKKAKEWDQAVDKLNDAGFSFEKGTDDMFISGGIPTAFLTKVIK